MGQGQMELNDFLGGLFDKLPPTQKKAPKPATSVITQETRKESHGKTDKLTMHKAVIETLGSKELTANEIAAEMHKAGLLPYPARAIIQPRITELVQAGQVEAVGKKLDTETDRKVAVYKVVQDV